MAHLSVDHRPYLWNLHDFDKLMANLLSIPPHVHDEIKLSPLPLR